MPRASPAPAAGPQPPVLRLLSRNLGKLRQQAGLTQRGLARRARVSVSYVSMIEAGLRSPTLEVLARLAAALGAPLPSLFEEEALPGGGLDPALEPLKRLVAGRGLAGAEIQRLLTVARALFPGRGR